MAKHRDKTIFRSGSCFCADAPRLFIDQLLNARQLHDLRRDPKENNRRWDRCSCGDCLDQGRDRIIRLPDRDDLHHVSAATGDDEQSKADKNPVEREIIAPSHDLENEREGNRDVGSCNKGVGNNAGPEDLRIPAVTMAVRHEPIDVEEIQERENGKHIRLGAQAAGMSPPSRR